MSFLPDTECVCGHTFPKHVRLTNGFFVMTPCSNNDILYGIKHNCNCEYFEEFYGDRNEY